MEFKVQIKRVHLDGTLPGVRVPFNELTLSNGEKLLLPTTEGEPRQGQQCLRVRDSFGADRKRRTQLEAAREGEITPEMEYVAIRESAATGADMYFTPEMVRAEIAAGRAVIPGNYNHPECEPMILGKRFSVKINANFGASALASGFDEELKKLALSIRFGADTVMDLSVGLPDLPTFRNAIMRASPVPVGTVPAYEALDRVEGNIGNYNWENFRDTLIDEARVGVDYFTIHAGLIQDLLPAAARRTLGIVSRGGAIMAQRMVAADEENIAYTHFDEILEICHQYDVGISLGDGLRPGAIVDACDEAQYGELRVLGELCTRAAAAGVQCFIEGPGHVPLHRIAENQRLEDEHCHEAPFYTLGPLVTDIAPGYDHITSVVGGAQIAALGTSMLCYVTPAEHLALPDADDVKQGLIAFKLAAHAADLARGLPMALSRDAAMARARNEFRWFDQFALSLDPEHAYAVWKRSMPENCSDEARFCSMCGPRFCPIRLNRNLREKYGH